MWRAVDSEDGCARLRARRTTLNNIYICFKIIVCHARRTIPTISAPKKIYLITICARRTTLNNIYICFEIIFRSARTSCTTSDPRGPVRAKNLDQLYSYINHHRTTVNLSDIVWCMSGGVWSMSDGVWWCLVMSGSVMYPQDM